MNRILLIIIMCLVGTTASAQYANINYDAKTVAAMAAAYGAETASEAYYNEQVKKILEKYTSAEVAAAAIFSSKFLDRKALPILVSGAVPPRIITTNAFTAWCPPKSSPRFWWSPG